MTTSSAPAVVRGRRPVHRRHEAPPAQHLLDRQRRCAATLRRFVRDDFVEIILNTDGPNRSHTWKAEYRDRLARHDRCQQIGRHVKEK
jgi:hypothetical protein